MQEDTSHRINCETKWTRNAVAVCLIRFIDLEFYHYNGKKGYQAAKAYKPAKGQFQNLVDLLKKTCSF